MTTFSLLQQMSNGPMDPSLPSGCHHDEQIDELQFLLTKRAKDIDRVGIISTFTTVRGLSVTSACLLILKLPLQVDRPLLELVKIFPISETACHPLENKILCLSCIHIHVSSHAQPLNKEMIL